jgi:hypothetical protein
LRSNVVEVEVNTGSTLEGSVERARRYLAHPAVVRCLYHREAGSRSAGVGLLHEFLDGEGTRSVRAAYGLYALGRIYRERGRRRHGTPWSRNLLAKGRRLLTRALDTGRLSPHRERIAEGLVDRER